MKMAQQTLGYKILPVITMVAIALLQISTFVGVQGFTVAVYEHLDPSRDAAKPLVERMLDSVAAYAEQARRAAEQGVHLLVFPELGITGLKLPESRALIRPYLQVLPHLKVNRSQHWIPCLETDTGLNVTVIHRLSCVARQTGVVLVANIATILMCLQATDEEVRSESTCPEDGAYYFNTDVVFDTDGTVLALYHKINTYLEPLFDSPPYSSTDVGITFTTSEATFGLITCFDIVWHRPLVTLVEQGGARHIVMSAAWYDGLPYLTSVQSQLALSIGLNVTFIVANLHHFPGDLGGSGIYLGNQGIGNYTYGPLSEGFLLVAGVADGPPSFVPNHSKEMNYEYMHYDDLSGYTLREVDQSSTSASATNGNLTCNVRYEFEVKTQTENTGLYYLAVYQGMLALGRQTYRLAVENCALLWCANADRPLTTCARPPVNGSQARLRHLTIDGNFTTSYVYPSMLNFDLQLIETSEWTFTKRTSGESGVISNETAARIATKEDFLYRPLVAALFGRNYDQDLRYATAN